MQLFEELAVILNVQSYYDRYIMRSFEIRSVCAIGLLHFLIRNQGLKIISVQYSCNDFHLAKDTRISHDCAVSVYNLV